MYISYNDLYLIPYSIHCVHCVHLIGLYVYDGIIDILNSDHIHSAHTISLLCGSVHV